MEYEKSKVVKENRIMTDVERFKQITDAMTSLYSKKNSNYGNSFEKLYNDLGPIAGLVPLHNKLDRLTNIVKGGKNDFESLEDTLIDLANYAIMNIIELQKAKELKEEYNTCIACGTKIPNDKQYCISCEIKKDK